MSGFAAQLVVGQPLLCLLGARRCKISIGGVSNFSAIVLWKCYQRCLAGGSRRFEARSARQQRHEMWRGDAVCSPHLISLLLLFPINVLTSRRTCSMDFCSACAFEHLSLIPYLRRQPKCRSIEHSVAPTTRIFRASPNTEIDIVTLQNMHHASARVLGLLFMVTRCR